MRPGLGLCGVVAAGALFVAAAPAADPSTLLRTSPSTPLRAGPHRLDQPASRVQLRDVAAAAGVGFVRHIGSASEKFYVDSVPGGLAIFDYNGDGRPDIFFTDGAELPSLEK